MVENSLVLGHSLTTEQYTAPQGVVILNIWHCHTLGKKRRKHTPKPIDIVVRAKHSKSNMSCFKDNFKAINRELELISFVQLVFSLFPEIAGLFFL